MDYSQPLKSVIQTVKLVYMYTHCSCSFLLGAIHLVRTHLGVWGWGMGEASFTFPLHINAKRGWVGPDSM